MYCPLEALHFNGLICGHTKVQNGSLLPRLQEVTIPVIGFRGASR